MESDFAVKRFRMELLRKMPFYGDIVMRLPFVPNRSIPTARTDGRKIEYNPAFFETLSPGQRNFVLLHEVFHVLLFHGKRHGERDPKLWNTAADMIVNSMLGNMTGSMRERNIPFERPKEGIFEAVAPSDTVETLYAKLLLDNAGRKDPKKVTVRQRQWNRTTLVEKDAPDDIILRDDGQKKEPDGAGRRGSLPDGEDSSPRDKEGLSEQALLSIIREAASANRSDFGSYYIPNQIYGLVESKRIKWQTLLRDFFTDEISEESSYTTPERKYLHMDLILPGYGRDEEKIEEIWAFVDSSGSIGKNEMEQFLTQLYRISKEFKCVFNICYWDTQVTDVYKKVLREDDILKSLPSHSGGTDINCVYRWLQENKVRPDVMLILTDGYFGRVDRSLFLPSLRRKTILVLSGSIPISNDLKAVGRITRL